MTKAIIVRRKYHSRGQPYMLASCEPHKINRCKTRYDDDLTEDENHISAAKALIDMIEMRAGYSCGFEGKWTLGWIDNGQVVFVQHNGPQFIRYNRFKGKVNYALA